MAKLTLTIGNMTSEIEVEDSVAKKIRDRAWIAYHRNGERATDQEKLDWVVTILLRDALSRASAKKDRVEEREARRAEHQARRELRNDARRAERTALKFE